VGNRPTPNEAETYDAAGDLLTLKSSNSGGASDTYTYDQLNRLGTVTDAFGATTYAYDAVGNLQNFTYPNGVTHAYSYDTLNRLTQVGAAKNSNSLSNYAYTLGTAGNRLTVAELSGRTVNYGYDSLYRLTSEAVSSDPNNHNGTTSYVYDAVGNRQQLLVNGVTANSYTYDADDRLGSDQYDADGNTINSLGTANTYDFENHLIGHGGVTLVYDGDGNRVSETVGGVTTNYLVDTNNPTGYAQVVDESQSGTVARAYSFGLERISEVQTLNSVLTTSFYGYDGHGSVRQLTNSAGAITDSYDYDAFGNLVNSTGTTPNVYLFAGEQYDPALALYYNRARYLNVTTGRFWSMDTYEGNDEDPISLHKYLYAGENPANMTDPSGHDDLAEVSFSISVSVGLGAAAGYAYTGSLKGAEFGALGGGIVGLTLAFGSSQQKVDVIVAGTSNAAFQALSNFLTEYQDQILNIPPPTQQQERELIVEAFAAGTTNAVIGTTFGLSPSISGITNAVTTAYYQGRSLRSALPSAIVGALTGYISGEIQLPGGNDVGLYAIGRIITSSTLKTISTASSPILKATIQALDSNLYNLLYGQ
jgi:RHS repeat-associated protein